MIRVLVVDDSNSVRELLVHILGSAAGLAVVGCAADGEEALRLAHELQAGRDHDGPADAAHGRLRGDPPHHAGLPDAHRGRQRQHRPGRGRRELPRDRGGRPGAGAAPARHRQPGPRRERAGARAHGQGDGRSARGAALERCPAPPPPAAGRAAAPGRDRRVDRRTDRAARHPGRTAGRLPAAGGDRPAPRARLHATGWPTWLADASGYPVEVLQDGAALTGGRAYLVPEGWQAALGPGLVGRLVPAPPEHGMCPSVSHLFRAIDPELRPATAAVLLTGMGKDGAAELKLLREHGALTIAQDRASAVVYGMPGEACGWTPRCWCSSRPKSARCWRDCRRSPFRPLSFQR
jgi:two-component system chemotaxis response regulator CheB